jgi:hypothetical protein
MGSHPASGGYKYRGLVLWDGGWAWGTQPYPVKRKLLRSLQKSQLGCDPRKEEEEEEVEEEEFHFKCLNDLLSLYFEYLLTVWCLIKHVIRL